LSFRVFVFQTGLRNDAVSSKFVNFDEVQFSKTANLIGTLADIYT